MSLFGNLGKEGLEQSEDRLGGVNIIATDIYEATIKVAYAGKSEGGAQSLTILFDLPGGVDYRETTWLTNRKGENWFPNKQDSSKKVPLPGFTVAEDLCLCATGKPLSEQDSAEKILSIYDSEAKKELPKAVMTLPDLQGKKVLLGIVKATVDKQIKNTTTGNYEPTGESREENNIEKVFEINTRMTVSEARNGKEKGEFIDAWQAKHKDTVRDKRSNKGSTPGAPTRPGAAPAAAPQAGAPVRKSLFGSK